MKSHFHAIYITVLVMWLLSGNYSNATAMRAAEPPTGFKSFVEAVEKETGYTIGYSEADVTVPGGGFPDIKGLSAEQALRKVLPVKQYALITQGKHIIILKNNDPGPATEPVKPVKPVEPLPPVEPVESVQPAQPEPPEQPEVPVETTVHEVKQVPEDRTPSEQRLLIIKANGETSVDVLQPQSEADMENINGETEKQEQSSTLHLHVINASTGEVIPAGRARGPVTAREIPFREDLLEVHVYTKPEPGKKKRRNRK